MGVSCSRLCSGVGLLGSFPLMASFISGVSRLDSVPGDELIGCEGIAGNDLGRPDGGSKGCNFLVLHYSGKPLLSYFQARVAANRGRD